MNNKRKLAVFDMDGTLFDTAEVNYCSYAEAAGQLGYKLDREKFLEIFVGKNYKEFLPEFGIIQSAELHKIHELKKEYYPKFLGKVKKNEALFELIESIKKDYIIALATTASKKNVLDILAFFDLESKFDFMITQEDTSKLKPDPECYIRAMEKAGVSASKTIIFEDSEVGMKAARESGGYVVKVSM